MYASIIGNLMQVHVCTKLDITFVVVVLGRYKSNPNFDHLKVAKNVMRYL